MKPGQKVWYFSAVNRRASEALVDSVNPDGTVNVSFLEHSGLKFSVSIAQDYPIVDIRGIKLLNSYVSETPPVESSR